MEDGAGRAHLDAYLQQVQRHLHGLPDLEAREVIAELRSHVLDAAGVLTPESVEAAIAELGEPRMVARANVTERVVADLGTRSSPPAVFGGIARLAGLSLFGLFAFVASILGYGLAIGVLGTAGSRLLFRLTKQPQIHSVAGLGLDPSAIAAACVVAWLTWRFGIFSIERIRRTAQRKIAEPMST